jgi:pimeloyl-ACP methyl ester carboxylesterase
VAPSAARAIALLAALTIALCAGLAQAADPPVHPAGAVVSDLDSPAFSPSASAAKPDSTGKLNVPAPTLGGKQLWTDELLFRDWRIQRNVLTANYRLLDGSDVRHAWGTFAECRNRLDQIRRDQKLPPMQGKVVILLHGLGRTRAATHGMERYLTAQSNFTVLEFGYASTRAEVADHAKSLAHVLQNLDGIEEIDFVAHSLGNLVIRHYLADANDPAQGHVPDPRIKRIVMLGPPNNGAHMAQVLGDNKLYKTLTGESGTELGPGWPGLQRHLATPDCSFGIIAGARPDQRARNPLLEGGDDLIVSVPETKLRGADDFLVLPVVHTFMMDDAKVREATLHFLREDCFVSQAKREPIPR